MKGEVWVQRCFMMVLPVPNALLSVLFQPRSALVHVTTFNEFSLCTKFFVEETDLLRTYIMYYTFCKMLSDLSLTVLWEAAIMISPLKDKIIAAQGWWVLDRETDPDLSGSVVYSFYYNTVYCV